MLIKNLDKVNNYQKNCYTNVFLNLSSWCNICIGFDSADIDVRHVCNREKILEPLGLESDGLFFQPGVTP